MAKTEGHKESAAAWAEEIDALMNIAEELQQQCDVVASRIAFSRLAELVLIGLLVIGLAGGFDALLPSHYSFYVRALFSVIPLLYIALFEITMISRLVRRRRRDARALFEIVGILRETERVSCDKGNWSNLQRGKFRIRLSRFDIGSRSEPYDRWGTLLSRIFGVQPP